MYSVSAAVFSNAFHGPHCDPCPFLVAPLLCLQGPALLCQVCRRERESVCVREPELKDSRNGLCCNECF